MKSIEVENLKFKYDSHQDHYTLDGVTFSVEKGEWLSIIGHNGSGKSTTVRLIDGLLPAESGVIKIMGQELTENNVWDLRRRIGMVFQNPDNQFVGATVEDDIAFGLENQGVAYEEMRQRVSQALELVGMTEFRTREPARLSGGQKQRVAIAGVVAMQPDIIILDEATSMLDPKGRLELIETIKAIHQSSGITVISITHDLDEVALSDRVLVMKKGQVAFSSTPKELFSKGEELLDLGLDLPFTVKLSLALEQQFSGFKPEAYQTEEELEQSLWEFISKM